MNEWTPIARDQAAEDTISSALDCPNQFQSEPSFHSPTSDAHVEFSLEILIPYRF